MARFAAAVWQLAHHLHPHESLVEERCAGSGIRAVAAYSAHSYQNRSRRAGQHRHQGASRWDRGAKKNGPQAIGKSRGGWTTKIHMVAADARTAITFALSPGQHHDAPAGRQLLRNEIERLFRRLKGFRRIFSRFDKLDVMFIAFINFALIVDGLR